MSYETLLSLGAEPVAGRVYLKHIEVGRFVDGQFLMAPEGEEAIARAKPEEPQQIAPAPEPAPAPAPAKPRASKAARVVEPAPTPEPDVIAGLDNLLN